MTTRRTFRIEREFRQIMRAKRIGPSRRRRALRLHRAVKQRMAPFYSYFLAPVVPREPLIEVQYD